MAVDADYQSLIIAELQLNSGMAALVPTVWSLYADKSTVAGRLQYLYTALKMADIASANTQQVTDWSQAGVSQKDGQVFDHVQELRENIKAELEKVEQVMMASAAPAVGQITAVSPVEPFSGAPDPSDIFYRGDPRRPGYLRVL